MTGAVSKSARSLVPRLTLRATVRSRPGSSVVVISGSSLLSGLASRSVVRRGSAASMPEPVEVGLADEREVDHLDVALARERATDAPAHRLRRGEAATRRRRSAARSGRPRSRRSRATSSTRSNGSVRSGRQAGTVAVSVVGAGLDLAADGLEVGDGGVARRCPCR